MLYQDNGNTISCYHAQDTFCPSYKMMNPGGGEPFERKSRHFYPNGFFLYINETFIGTVHHFVILDDCETHL
jgi:hypothetical protein